MNRFSYKDWLTCKVVLKYDLFIPSGENPVLVGWDSFNEHDINLIKTEQKRIFEESIEKLFLKFKNLFLDNYSRSLEKELCVINEIHQCEVILKAKIPKGNSKFLNTNYWGCVFTSEEIINIQVFYSNNIVRGLKFELDFIHPQNSKFQNSSIIHASIYCHTLLKFRDWLFSNYSQQSQLQETLSYSDSKQRTALGVNIQNHLNDLKSEFNDKTDFENAIKRIEEYWHGNVNLTEKAIFIRNGNLKKLAYALGEIWRENSNQSISYEYLIFCKNTFTIFSNQIISKKRCFSCNLYKYMIS